MLWSFRPHQRSTRIIVSIYMGLLISASAMNALLLFRSMLHNVPESGEQLLFAGFGVLSINVLSFGLVYWQIDGGGPGRRAENAVLRPDFQFPQQTGQPFWVPTLPDYLFTAYTNIIAFSPTDTMPLTHRVKLLFTIQSSISLVTVLVTMSRAINLLNQPRRVRLQRPTSDPAPACPGRRVCRAGRRRARAARRQPHGQRRTGQRTHQIDPVVPRSPPTKFGPKVRAGFIEAPDSGAAQSPASEM